MRAAALGGGEELTAQEPLGYSGRMKDKLLVLACAAVVLASAATVVASLSTRARAAMPDAGGQVPMRLIARNPAADVYLVGYRKTACFVATSATGGVSINCLPLATIRATPG